MAEYFVVGLLNGITIDFDKRCNRVDYNNERYVIFRHYDSNNKVYETLGIVPHHSISTIIKMKVALQKEVNRDVY